MKLIKFKEKNNSKKQYSKLNEIKIEDAPTNIVEGCMVIEGGAFRGTYASGVLDCLMENGINLRTTIGVSAGALNGINYVAGNIGRSGLINLKYRHDKRYVGVVCYKENSGVYGFNFLYHTLAKIEKFNEERFLNPDRRFIAVATSCVDGKPMYFEKGIVSDIYKAAQASASMPYVSKMVEVDGIPCLDGGCSLNIPYQWAIDNNFEKIIVIRTREKEYRKEISKKNEAIIRTFYLKHKEFSDALVNSNNRYNNECDEIEKLTEEGRIFTIYPSTKVTVGRLEPDLEKLGDLYFQGYNDALNLLPEIKKYLNIV